MKQAAISRLIKDKKFQEAAALLKRHIAEAEILDPRRDDSWAIDADILGFAVLDHRGAEEFRAYWQDCLRFFIEELEPNWRHLHKGHIYLRLGMGYLATDLAEAAQYFNKGLQEDRLVAESRKANDPELDPEETVRDSPAYITLCTVRILDLWSYPSKASKKSFFQNLVRVKFDVIWGPQEADARRVKRALRRIESRQPERIIAAKHELDQVFDRRLPLAIISTLESFLKIFLISLLSTEPPAADRPVRRTLQELLAAARAGNLFPDPTIQTVFEMAGILSSLFPFLEKTDIPEELTPRVLLQISIMMKILVDLALIRWSEAL